MTYTVRIYQRLEDACVAIRTAVFVEEQGFQQEFDEIDSRAWHVLVYDGEIAAATGRLYTDDGECYHIGRVAVLPAYRGKQLGRLVISALEAQAVMCGGREISLSAQCRVAGFYEKLGYARTEDLHMDEFCPHVTMVKQIGQVE